MRIDPQSQVAGVPAVVLRDFLRQVINNEWTTEAVVKGLKLSHARAERVISRLLSEGYIKETELRRRRQLYQLAPLGRRLALATAARPLTRETAQRNLQEFLDRVRALNEDDRFCYRVQRVLLFGSFLAEQDRINDIDVAVELARRENDPDRWDAARHACIRKALAEGRQFRNLTEELCWPEIEVQRFLKSRSRAISLHPADDPVLKMTLVRVIFEDHGRSQATSGS